MAGYGSDQGLTDWLTANGLTLPETAPTSAVLRERGAAYIDGLYGSQFSDRRFSGVPTGGFAQERAWPRTGASAYGVSIDEDVIPVAVEQASYSAAWYEGNNPGKLAVAATQGGQVKRIKVDVIEKEFFDRGGDAASSATPVLSTVEGLLAPFLIFTRYDGPAIWAIG